MTATVPSVLASLLVELDGLRADCRALLAELPAVQHWQGQAATAFADSLFSLRTQVSAAADELDAVMVTLTATGRPAW